MDKIKGSPVSAVKGQKASSLVGSYRKVKDTAVDLHNLCQKWAKLNSEGTTTINEIANCKLQYIFGEQSERNEDTEILPESLMPEKLEEQCNTLALIVEKLKKVVSKIEAIAAVFKGVTELEYHKADIGSKDGGLILFQTWKMEEFESATLDLLKMYKKELELKKLLVENVCHVKDRNTMMFYTSAWLHQPYIDKSSMLLLESMLIETGHR